MTTTWTTTHCIGFALALALAGALLLARWLVIAPSARRGVLLALRGVARVLLVLILLDPVHVTETHQPGPEPVAVVLMDGSRSMALEAPFSRAQAVGEFWSQALAQIPPERRPRLDRYRFGGELAALSDADGPVEPSDDETRLATALEHLPRRFGEVQPFAVVVFSDGRSTEPDDLGVLGAGFKDLGVPVHVVPIGDPAIRGDVAIQDLVAPRDAPPGTKVPVRVVVRSRAFAGQRAEVRIAVPPTAEDHPIYRFTDNPLKNRQILARMPAFRGTNLIDRLKPAATLLGRSDRPLPGRGVLPILACQEYGRGRTFAMATDSTLDWGWYFERSWGENDNRYFRQFWRNVIRWLAENSAGANRRLRVETDRVVDRPGQPIQITARAYDENLEATDRYQVVAGLRPEQGDAPAGSAVTLTPRIEDQIYLGILNTPPVHMVAADPGSTLHRVVLDVRATDGSQEAARAELPVQVIDDPAEFRDPRPDPARLAALARASGGTMLYRPDELARPTAADRVRVTRAPLWDRPCSGPFCSACSPPNGSCAAAAAWPEPSIDRRQVRQGILAVPRGRLGRDPA